MRIIPGHFIVVACYIIVYNTSAMDLFHAMEKSSDSDLCILDAYYCSSVTCEDFVLIIVPRFRLNAVK
jgi:hypothetical protein